MTLPATLRNSSKRPRELLSSNTIEFEAQNHMQLLARHFSQSPRKRSEDEIGTRQSEQPSTPSRKRRKSQANHHTTPSKALDRPQYDSDRTLSNHEDEMSNGNTQTHQDESPIIKDEPFETDDDTVDFASSPPIKTESSTQCRCPIDKKCPARVDHLIDCRTLVLEWKAWERRTDKTVMKPSALVTAEFENFINENQIREIHKYLDQVEARPRLSPSLQSAFDMVQYWIRKMCEYSVTSEVLESSNVLPRLESFLDDKSADMRRRQNVPDFLVEDLTIILRKLSSGDLSCVPTRGLEKVNGSSQYSVIKSWKWKRSGSYFGHGDLINGQMWPNRSALNRDGAHSDVQAGIAGRAETGAYSIVMGYHDDNKKRYYADVDQDEKIFYYGTALPRPTGDEEETNIRDTPAERLLDPIGPPTAKTRALMRSRITGEPVRVFRSFRLSEIVPGRPQYGYRYDGLYKVVRYELMKVRRQIYRFELERMKDGQGPLRYKTQEPRRTGRD